MKTTIALIALFLCTGLMASPPSFPVLNVEDGDTLLLEMEGQPVRVQLIGIDAPEEVENPKLVRDEQRTGLERQSLLELGRQASSHLRSLVPAHTEVFLVGDLESRDKYGRIPALVLGDDGQNLNAAMVGGGYAITLSEYPLDDALRQQLTSLQAEARSGRRGLWGTHPGAMSAWSGEKPQP